MPTATAAERRAAAATTALAALRATCAPVGDLRPWIDNRAHTCTLCAEFVDKVATSDGDDWCARDGAGLGWARHPLPELCDCLGITSGLNTRSGRILDSTRGRGPTVACDEPRAHYGHGLPIETWSFGHPHNARGGEIYYTERSTLSAPCGWRPLATRRTQPIEPLATDRTPPVCHRWPMRFAPRGWCCRVSGRYFVPDLDTP